MKKTIKIVAVGLMAYAGLSCAFTRAMLPGQIGIRMTNQVEPTDVIPDSGYASGFYLQPGVGAGTAGGYLVGSSSVYLGYINAPKGTGGGAMFDLSDYKNKIKVASGACYYPGSTTPPKWVDVTFGRNCLGANCDATINCSVTPMFTNLAW
jgi:hypothetical protein